MKKLIMVIGISLQVFVFGASCKELKPYCGFEVEKQLKDINKNQLYFSSTPNSLKNIKEFYRLQLCAPVKYKVYMAGMKPLTMDEQIILVHSMQVLSGPSYEYFILEMLAKYEKREIKKHLLQLAIFPGNEWNTYLTENYDGDNVVKIIEKLKHEFPKKIGSLDEIESGRSLEQLVVSRFNSISPAHSFKYLEFN
jgi:hypothetical protein